MKNFIALTLLLACIAPYTIYAQKASLAGTIIDIKDRQPLIGATVEIQSTSDTLDKKGLSTDQTGKFKFDGLKRGNYKLTLSYIGYKTSERMVLIDKRETEMGELVMLEDEKVLNEAVVTELETRVEQNGDTTQYNANAFKVNKDATAEDLLVKMPGITSDNGTLKVNGEEVRKVTVDGKAFFGDDPRTAVQNLPADVIDKIQVFDKMSDQSAFTGFDDGNSQKAINIITRNGISDSKFGKAYAGYGAPDHRYNVGGTYSRFKKDMRFSLLGMSNNINTQNFNMQDLMGAMSGGAGMSVSGRMGGGRGGRMGAGMQGPASQFMVNQQNGIATTSSIGVNFNDKFGKKKQFSFSGSYFFNHSNNVASTNTLRNYVSSLDSGLVYTEDKFSESQNFNHRANLKLEYTIDSSNTLTITPTFTTQNFSSKSLSNALNTKSNQGFISSSQNDQNSEQFGINFSNDILYQHKFAKRGRTISVNLTTSLNNRDNEGGMLTQNRYASDASLLDSIDQRSNTKVRGFTQSANVSYTEPLGVKGQLSISYQPSYNRNTSDKRTNLKNETTGNYTDLDSTLSNEFNNTYFTNRFGASYRANYTKSNFAIGVDGQMATLKGNQIFPNPYEVSANFINVLPFAEFNYRPSRSTNLRTSYRTSTQSPSINQLQNVLDNSNILILSTGNPNLSQTFTQNLIVRYSKANPQKGTNFFVFANASNTLNYIANSTNIFRSDTVINDVAFAKGTQLSRPTNMNGYWSARTFANYGFPITAIKCNFNVNAGATYSLTPALVNDLLNESNNLNLSTGFTLGSNISKKIDFTIAYSINYNIIRNSLQIENNNNFLNHTASGKINYQFWKGFVVNTSIANTLNAGGSSSYNTSFWLWNAHLAYKFLKNENLEFKLSVNDILGQNRSIVRNVTDIYTEDLASNVLQRYFMATLTYTFRKINAKDQQDMDKMKEMIPPHRRQRE